MSMVDIKRDMLRGVSDPFSKELYDKVFGFTPTEFKGNGRRINRFMVGADPEFMLENASGQVHASALGLKPALAFGADQNDRLVELRPAASRSTLEVTASVLAELRWMYRIMHATGTYRWRSGAYAHGDGMGGHVHFGRKRATRAEEIAGLDGLAKTIRRTALLPVKEWATRVQGDQFGQRYGQYSDIRLQKHGYEYRTLPSWLDSPKLAFLILTLSKLVVVDPEITRLWNEKTGTEAWSLLRGLAKLYKGRDDDAWMLYSMMADEGDWAWIGGEFRSRWGIPCTGVSAEESGFVYPSCIAATKEDVSDLHDLFVKGSSLPMRRSEPHFRHKLPNNYHWVIQSIKCGRRPGVGELLYDWVLHKDLSFVFTFESDSFSIYVPPTFKGISEFRARFPEVEINMADVSFSANIGRKWRTGAGLARTREVFLSGLLPIYQVDNVGEDSHSKYRAVYLPETKKVKGSESPFMMLDELREMAAAPHLFRVAFTPSANSEIPSTNQEQRDWLFTEL